MNIRAMRAASVGTEARRLRGIAEATLENPVSPVRLLGTWHLRKQDPVNRSELRAPS